MLNPEIGPKCPGARHIFTQLLRHVQEVGIATTYTCRHRSRITWSRNKTSTPRRNRHADAGPADAQLAQHPNFLGSVRPIAAVPKYWRSTGFGLLKGRPGLCAGPVTPEACRARRGRRPQTPLSAARPVLASRRSQYISWILWLRRSPRSFLMNGGLGPPAPSCAARLRRDGSRAEPWPFWPYRSRYRAPAGRMASRRRHTASTSRGLMPVRHAMPRGQSLANSR